jgi:SEC-C motif domain protein
MKCPCHSHQPYEACCKRYHDGALAENALILMRSRYSAYALQLVDYIIRTTAGHANRPDIRRWKKEIETFSQTTDFIGLEIIDFTEKSDRASVTFRAILKQNQRDTSFSETSLFVKKNNQWYYREPVNLSRDQ